MQHLKYKRYQLAFLPLKHLMPYKLTQLYQNNSKKKNQNTHPPQKNQTQTKKTALNLLLYTGKIQSSSEMGIYGWQVTGSYLDCTSAKAFKVCFVDISLCAASVSK